ncbi:hypothetical protein D3C73_1545750 [compost metagenome]
MQYQQLLRQEQSNAEQLNQIAQREQQAAHIIQTALQGHQTAIQQLQQIANIAQQIAHTATQNVSHIEQPYNNPLIGSPASTYGNFSNQNRQ